MVQLHLSLTVVSLGIALIALLECQTQNPSEESLSELVELTVENVVKDLKKMPVVVWWDFEITGVIEKSMKSTINANKFSVKRIGEEIEIFGGNKHFGDVLVQDVLKSDAVKNEIHEHKDSYDYEVAAKELIPKFVDEIDKIINS